VTGAASGQGVHVEPRLLSIVIVSWNRAAELERCLNSVLKHTQHSPLEVIVVDNGSDDGSREVARSLAPTVRLIENERNLGAPAARNQGMAASNGELIALLDCDTFVADDVIGRATQTLFDRPDVGMLGAKLCFPDGRRQHSAHRAMSIRNSLLQNLWLYRLLPSGKRAELLLGGYYEEDREVEVDWLTGAFLIFRRELFRESGGFNPSLFPEDSEWGIRLSRRGHRILYAPQVGVVYHTGSSSLWGDEKQLRRYHWAGIEAYRALNGSRLAVAYRFVQLFGTAVRWIVYATAAGIRSSPYLTAQAGHYRTLVNVYLKRPGASAQ
jgi:GT2 family glycosyltransferase